MTPKEKAKELIDKFTVHTKVFHQEIGWEEYMDSAKCPTWMLQQCRKKIVYTGTIGQKLEPKSEQQNSHICKQMLNNLVNNIQS